MLYRRCHSNHHGDDIFHLDGLLVMILLIINEQCFRHTYNVHILQIFYIHYISTMIICQIYVHILYMPYILCTRLYVKYMYIYYICHTYYICTWLYVKYMYIYYICHTYYVHDYNYVKYIYIYYIFHTYYVHDYMSNICTYITYVICQF